MILLLKRRFRMKVLFKLIVLISLSGPLSEAQAFQSSQSEEFENPKLDVLCTNPVLLDGYVRVRIIKQSYFPETLSGIVRFSELIYSRSGQPTEMFVGSSQADFSGKDHSLYATLQKFDLHYKSGGPSAYYLKSKNGSDAFVCTYTNAIQEPPYCPSGCEGQPHEKNNNPTGGG